MSEERYLAHRIIYQGKEYPLSILTLRRHEGQCTVIIEKFQAETPGTVFHSGTIRVNPDHTLSFEK